MTILDLFPKYRNTTYNIRVMWYNRHNDNILMHLASDEDYLLSKTRYGDFIILDDYI